jgi:hypothetical protein
VWPSSPLLFLLTQVDPHARERIELLAGYIAAHPDVWHAGIGEDWRRSGPPAPSARGFPALPRLRPPAGGGTLFSGP